MEKETLHAIMDAIGQTSIAECEIVAKNGSIRIVRKPGAAVSRPGEVRPSLAQESVSGADSNGSSDDADLVDVTSSWVGFF